MYIEGVFFEIVNIFASGVHMIDYIMDFFRNETVVNILKSAGFIIVFVGAALFLLKMVGKIFPILYKKILSWKGTKIPTIMIRSRKIVSDETLTSSILSVLQGARLILSLLIIYFTLILSINALPWTEEVDFRSTIDSIISALFVLLMSRFALKWMQSLYLYLKERIGEWKGTSIQSVAISNVELLSGDRIAEILFTINSGLRLFFGIIIVYLTLTSIFGFFEFTREWSAQLLQYILSPLTETLKTIINYIPNLFTIIVIAFVTRYAVKIVHLVFTEVEKGNITLPGFHEEWSEPTFKIVRFLIFAFAAVVIFPYLPGSGSQAFQGVSVFLGILFSLGSSSAIANVVAGIVLTYMRPFKIGDRVKIADTMGDVVEKTLLVTRMRTIKNVDITIPNAMVLGAHIINFSSSASEKGLILHTGVTIGYDAPWRTVHQLLISAAEATENILKDPKPFILQTSLDDFYVSYELNAYTGDPSVMARTYSDLHQNIQDKFNEAGVEIMSPHYGAVRDGNQVTIPQDYLPKEYTAPSFKVGFINLPGAVNNPPKG